MLNPHMIDYNMCKIYLVPHNYKENNTFDILPFTKFIRNTCWERAGLFAVVIVVFGHFPKCVLVHIRIKGEVGAVKLV